MASSEILSACEAQALTSWKDIGQRWRKAGKTPATSDLNPFQDLGKGGAPIFE